MIPSSQNGRGSILYSYLVPTPKLGMVKVVLLEVVGVGPISYFDG